MKRRIMRGITAAALACAVGLTPAFALAAGVVTDKASIGGGATLVYMTMGGGRTGEITLPGGSVSAAQSADAHLAQKRGEGGKTIVASVNGGYFDAYSGANTTYATIVQNGMVVNGGGSQPMLAFTDTGRPLIDRVKIDTAVKFRGGQAVTAWGVNSYFDDTRAVSLFTAAGRTVNIPSSAKIVWIKGGAVSSITDGGQLRVPAGSQALVINAGQWATLESYAAAPRVGNTAELTTTFTPSGGNAEEWAHVVNGVGAGPHLLQNGQDVTGTNSDFTDPKQGIDVVSARSFAAVMGDGRLVLGTASSASMRQITKYLKDAGAVDAMALDGGASAMLYVGDVGYAHSAGRNLSNVLHIVDYSAGTVPQAVKPAAPVDAPSAWAADTVSAAKAAGLVPEGLQSGYQQNITREEFCSLMVPLLKARLGESYKDVVFKTGVSYEEAKARYTDTWSNDVIACTQLGLVSGVGDGKFDPNAPITRQEAAKMLAATAKTAGVSASGSAPQFPDAASIAPWAVEGVDFVCAAGIMNGDGDLFNPEGFFTREQAIATIYRML